MSFHNKPDYHIPELIEALKAHRLPHDTPSQLADSFRIGWMARASHGQAPAQPDQPIACSYGDNGYACCEGGPCQADVHNDKLAEQQAPQPVAREPLTPERVKEIVRGAGYDQRGIPDTERAAFINGLRHGEREHGIKRGQHGTK